MARATGVGATVGVNLEELLEALEYLGAGHVGVHRARHRPRSLRGTDVEPGDGAPADLETSDRHLTLPSRQDLDLGRRVALRFADAHLPEHAERIRAMFSRPGAYARFKDLLEAGGHLAAWFEFDVRAQREALTQWCAAQGLTLTD